MDWDELAAAVARGEFSIAELEELLNKEEEDE